MLSRERRDELRLAVQNALVRVAENVAKHTINRDGWDKSDDCFLVDLRNAEEEIMAVVSVAAERAETLEAELAMWKPLTAEEAEKALAEAEAVPLSEERIKEMVKAALDPACRLPNSEQMQLAADNKRLRAALRTLAARYAESRGRAIADAIAARRKEMEG